MKREPANGQLRRWEHEWYTIRLGRMCWRCNEVQANDEFDDGTQCQPRPEWERVSHFEAEASGERQPSA